MTLIAESRRVSAKPARVAATFADGWFKQHGWKAFAFQREVWQAVALGKSGLLHATTGSGKTYAVWLAALNRHGEPAKASTPVPNSVAKKRAPRASISPPLTVLWITPMRALAADTERALKEPLEEMNLPWSVGVAVATRPAPSAHGNRAACPQR